MYDLVVLCRKVYWDHSWSLSERVPTYIMHYVNSYIFPIVRVLWHGIWPSKYLWEKCCLHEPCLLLPSRLLGIVVYGSGSITIVSAWVRDTNAFNFIFFRLTIVLFRRILYTATTSLWQLLAPIVIWSHVPDCWSWMEKTWKITLAKYVVNCVTTNQNCWLISARILERNHSNVIYVRRDSQIREV